MECLLDKRFSCLIINERGAEAFSLYTHVNVDIDKNKTHKTPTQDVLGQ